MHLKRLILPTYWKVRRKEKNWVYCPRPGPHPKNRCIPLGVILRDIISVANNEKEVRALLGLKKVKVDNEVRKDPNLSVGLMDVLTVGDRYFRVVPTIHGLEIISIPDKEANLKLVKVVNKVKLSKDKIQINLHDGRNILSKDDKYAVGDSLIIDLKDFSIKKQLPLKQGAEVLITDGRHSGEIAKFIERRKISMISDAALLEKKGGKFETLLKYLMPISDIKVSEK